MSSKKLKVVLGCNYGDEGKGLITDFLVKEAQTDNRSVLVCRFSGGANAGHTVQLPDGTRHVFSHFCSGSLRGANTALTEDFVVNPTLFFLELEELAPKVKQPFTVYVDPYCLVTTPWDVYINQALERKRGDGRHGSTGVGLHETVLRSDNKRYTLRAIDLLNPDTLYKKLSYISTEWFPQRLKDLNLECTIDIDSITFFQNCRDFTTLVNISPVQILMRLYDTIIFEGSQGLRLDQDSDEYPHVTHAHTGLHNVLPYLKYANGNDSIELVYVTRTYLTRHGAGDFEEDKSVLPVDKDLTNVDNEFQGSIKYGKLNIDTMNKDIRKDTASLTKMYTTTLAVTHYSDSVEDKNLVSALYFGLPMDDIIVSTGRTAEDTDRC